MYDCNRLLDYMLDSNVWNNHGHGLPGQLLSDSAANTADWSLDFCPGTVWPRHETDRKCARLTLCPETEDQYLRISSPDSQDVSLESVVADHTQKVLATRYNARGSEQMHHVLLDYCAVRQSAGSAAIRPKSMKSRWLDLEGWQETYVSLMSEKDSVRSR
jgi:hypothetical protein